MHSYMLYMCLSSLMYHLLEKSKTMFICEILNICLFASLLFQNSAFFQGVILVLISFVFFMQIPLVFCSFTCFISQITDSTLWL